MSQIFSVYAADIDGAASGDNTLIAAVTGRVIKVWAILITANAAVNIIFKHGSTAFNGHAMPITAQGLGFVLDPLSFPRWVCLPSEAFVLNLSGAVQMFGRVWYTVE